MPLKTYPRNPDGTYGPTNRNDYYRSKEDHRKNARQSFKHGKQIKTRWCIKESEEYHVFKIANEPYWFCRENNCLFGFIFENGRLLELGENGECLAKFPNDRNELDPWHGYPVFSERDENRPSSDLLDELDEKKIISYEYRIKIERGFI